MKKSINLVRNHASLWNRRKESNCTTGSLYIAYITWWYSIDLFSVSAVRINLLCCN
uniref:Uncharacterized protein n=1 Tax=Arundo donax TaxID=35708 RepID=A0A0A9ECH1_ARUDO